MSVEVDICGYFFHVLQGFGYQGVTAVFVIVTSFPIFVVQAGNILKELIKNRLWESLSERVGFTFFTYNVEHHITLIYKIQLIERGLCELIVKEYIFTANDNTGRYQQSGNGILEDE